MSRLPDIESLAAKLWEIWITPDQHLNHFKTEKLLWVDESEENKNDFRRVSRLLIPWLENLNSPAIDKNRRN